MEKFIKILLDYFIVFLLGFTFLFWALISVDDYKSFRTDPASIYKLNDTLDGYIIDCSLDGDHLYGHLPNDPDHTVYLLTVSISDNTSFLGFLFNSSDFDDYESIKEKFITLESVEVSKERPPLPSSCPHET